MIREERKRYLLHAKRQLRHRIKEAETRIIEGLANIQRPTISMSFGKDSTVMAHLLLTEFGQFPLIYVDCGTGDEWPDTARVKKLFLEKCPCELITLTGPSILDAFRENGFFLQDTPDTQTRKSEKSYADSLADTIDAYQHAHRYDGSFIGLRREESKNRKRLFAKYGSCYFAKTRKLWACHPLETWTGTDIWAYLLMYDLPYNSLYDTAIVGRERARNGAMLGNRGYARGRLVELKCNFPEWFNKLAKEFPEIRRYV